MSDVVEAIIFILIFAPIMAVAQTYTLLSICAPEVLESFWKWVRMRKREKAAKGLQELCQVIGCSGMSPDMCQNAPHKCEIIRKMVGRGKGNDGRHGFNKN